MLSSALQFSDLLIKLVQPFSGHFLCPVMVLPRVQSDQLLDLFEREASLLRFADEAKPPDILLIVAANAAVSHRCWQQVLPLIKADGLDADAASLGKFSNRKHLLPLDPVLWYRTYIRADMLRYKNGKESQRCRNIMPMAPKSRPSFTG